MWNTYYVWWRDDKFYLVNGSLVHWYASENWQHSLSNIIIIIIIIIIINKQPTNESSSSYKSYTDLWDVLSHFIFNTLFFQHLLFGPWFFSSLQIKFRASFVIFCFTLSEGKKKKKKLFSITLSTINILGVSIMVDESD